MAEEQMYELVCREKFEHILSKQDQTLKLLRGTNNEPGLMDRVRWLERIYKAVIGAIGFVLGVLTIQAILYVFSKLQ